MSTRINVNVDSGGLLERDKQQRAANRTARLIKENAAKAAEEGKKQRNKRREAEGLDPVTGLPIPSPGSSSNIRRYDQEPAANRQGGEGVLLIPDSGYTDFGGTLTGLRGRTRSGPVIFSRYDFQEQPFTDYADIVDVGRGSPELEFVPAGGPLGTNALRHVASRPPLEVQIRVKNAPTFGWRVFTLSNFMAPTFEAPWYTLFLSTPNINGISYALTQTSYDSIGAWVSNNLNLSTLELFPLELLDLNGNTIPATPKKKPLQAYTEVTHEFMVRMDNGSARFNQQRMFNATFGPVDETLLSSFVEIRADGARVTIRASEQSVFETSDLGFAFMVLTTNEFGFESQTTVLLSTTLDRLSVRVTGTGISVPEMPDIVGDEWIHCAIVRSIDPDTGLRFHSIYYNGVRISYGPLPSNWDEDYGQQPVSARFLLSSQPKARPEPQAMLPSIHGYRFTPKALYTGETIVPPRTITRFA